MVEEERSDEQPKRVSSDRERERVIQEVLRDAREKEAALEFQRLRYDQDRRRQGLGARHAVLLVTVLVTAWVWLAANPWLQPDPPEPPPVELLDASVRLALYLQAQEIESFRARTGRLPEDLSEVGGGLPGIRYARTVRGTYHLEAVTEEFVRFYSSSLAQTTEEFLDGAPGRVLPDGFGLEDS